MAKIPSTNMKLYADDAKLYRAIGSANDNQVLPEDLQCLEEWSELWMLRFHPGKWWESVPHPQRFSATPPAQVLLIGRQLRKTWASWWTISWSLVKNWTEESIRLTPLWASSAGHFGFWTKKLSPDFLSLWLGHMWTTRRVCGAPIWRVRLTRWREYTLFLQLSVLMFMLDIAGIVLEMLDFALLLLLLTIVFIVFRLPSFL